MAIQGFNENMNEAFQERGGRRNTFAGPFLNTLNIIQNMQSIVEDTSEMPDVNANVNNVNYHIIF